MQGQLSFAAVAIVVGFTGTGILHCEVLVCRFVYGLCLRNDIVKAIVGYSGLLPLHYCQWLMQQQLMEESIGEMVVVHLVVLLTIIQNWKQILDNCRMWVSHCSWCPQLLAVVVGFVGATSCDRCRYDSNFLSITNKWYNVKVVLYNWCKLIAIKEVYCRIYTSR